jgi:predicted acyl esterase
MAAGSADHGALALRESHPNVEGRMDYREKSEIRDGMRIDWDMPITMDDGLVLRCDIYRPIADGKYPVIMTYGPYGKWLH